jgi:hypothetical protein
MIDIAERENFENTSNFLKILVISNSAGYGGKSISFPTSFEV